jgi:hypothetical protein
MFAFYSPECLDLCGSGSMVSVGDQDYILTAAHVWKKFENTVGMGITLDKEDEDHRYFIRVDKIIPFGPELVSDRDPRART